MRRIVVLLLFCSGAAWAETEYWVSLGSYQAMENAENARADADARLTDSVQIALADTDRGLYYRVLAGPFFDQTMAEASLDSARASGFAGAWLLSTSEPLDVTSGSTYEYEYTPPPVADDDLDLPEFDAQRYEPPPARDAEPTYVEPVSEAPPGYNLHRLRREGGGSGDSDG